MKNRDLVIGALLAAVLVAGVWFARRPSQAARHSGPPAQGDTGVGVQGNLPDVSMGDGPLILDGVEVAVVARPRPLRPLQAFELVLAFTRAGQPVVVEAPRLSFRMVMDMGPQDYTLLPAGEASWVARDVVLPTCGSGGREWFATLGFSVDGRPVQGQFRLELQPGDAG